LTNWIKMHFEPAIPERWAEISKKSL
jgi:hypothetical protein